MKFLAIDENGAITFPVYDITTDSGIKIVSSMYPFPVTQFDEEMLIAGPAGTEIIALEESSSASTVLAEVHHTVAFDADKAWEAMRALSRGA